MTSTTKIFWSFALLQARRKLAAAAAACDERQRQRVVAAASCARHTTRRSPGCVELDAGGQIDREFDVCDGGTRAENEVDRARLADGSVTAGVSTARRAPGLRTYKPVKITVSIVRPNAPKKVNATMRCARVGFGRAAGARSALVLRRFVPVGVVTVGRLRRLVRLLFEEGRARRDHTPNASFHSAEPTPSGAGLKWAVAERQAWRE